jgi:tetratricopeptide (TPR) repeat protein
MVSPIFRNSLIILLLLSWMTLAAAQEKVQPLKASVLVALVAGDALSENVVHEIEARGLAFRPSDEFRSQLTTAGADSRILLALSKAKISESAAGPENKAAAEYLGHLAKAGKLVRDKQFEEAAAELNDALEAGGDPAAGFVMGALLRYQEQWPTSASVYEQVLKEDPRFPEVHTKLSDVQYHLGDSEESLRQAKAALAQYPENAEAHKNAGLALLLARKYDAAALEYREALRIKPDYELVRFDLGVLLHDKGDLDGSIAEYKKAIALDPNDVDARHNLGNAFDDKGDFASATRELREAKRLNPKDLGVRHDLGGALMDGNSYAQAVTELRELETMAPDWAMCRIALGDALRDTWDFRSAAKEYLKAAELEPSDPEPHIHLGDVYEDQKNFDAALEEFHRAQQLDENSPSAHRNAGRVFIAKKDFAKAVLELKQAEDLQPSDAYMHDLYGQALQGAGNIDAAIAQFKQSIALDPKQTAITIELAAAFEKKGDWVFSLEQYRKAALADASLDYRNKTAVRSDAPNPKKEYEAAQVRFSAYLAALKAKGKASEALALEARVHRSQAAPNLSTKLDEALQAGAKALSERHFDEARIHYQKAVKLAEQLQPHDQRLATALDYVGASYVGQDFAAANAAYSRELKVVQEIYGPQSFQVTQPLQSLGTSALVQRDYPTAQEYYSRAVEVNEQFFGEASDKVAESLRVSSWVYLAQKQFDKAELVLLRAVRIDESLFGRDGIDLDAPLSALCGLYDNWGKPDKLEPCNCQLLEVLEKQYGENSLQTVPVLKNQAQALRTLGRNEEATKVEQRIKTIQASTMNQN